VNSGSSGRFDGIDVLRGISIIAVVVHHINIHMGASESVLAKALPRQLAATLFWNGANGVTVFFAISGFLITTMAIRRWGALSQVRITDFYRLRFARIVPLLVALLIILSVLDLSHVPGFIIRAHTSMRAC
jgi:peptidoglycan/LPS O-acetylase OafA/YrhL